MTIGRGVKNAIQWHEGMLLLPQHFQQMDRRVEELFAFHLKSFIPYSWGLLNFTFDRTAIITGSLRILALDAIFPDGFAFSFSQGRGGDLFLDFSAYEQDLNQKAMTVYLLLPEYRSGRANVQGETPRFKSVESDSIVDENTGEGIMTVPLLEPNISLICAETPPPSTISLPLFKIQKIVNAYQILDYIPPQLTVMPHSALGLLCEDLTRCIREKMAFLTNRLTSQTSELMSAEAENAVKALSMGLLPLEALIAAGVSHPFDVFLQLTNLAAHIISISPSLMAPSFLPYNHEDIRSSYMQIIQFVESMLERIQEGYSVLPFGLKDRTFTNDLNPAWQTSRLILGAKASPSMSEKNVVDWISQALIATDNFVSACREKRILGAERKIISGAQELKLMPARNVILFSVEVSPHFIQFGHTLNLLNVADNPSQRPEEIVLYIPKNGGVP